MSTRVRFSTLAAAALALCASSARAELATALIREDDPLPAAGAGHTVSSLSNTAVNHVGGYAVSLNSTDGTTTLSHIWGNPAGGAGGIMRTEGTFGPLVQTSFESFYGMADDGSVAYSAIGTGGPVGGFDSVWKNDTPIAVEGDVYPHAANTWWRFGSRPGISGDGIPYFVGGLTFTQGGSTQNYGLFVGMAAAPLVLGGDLLPGMPAPLSNSSSISFDYRFSRLATAYIAEVDLDTTSSTDAAMVVNGAGLILGGTLVQEGNVVPLSVGGNGVEKWVSFDFTGITESGQWFFSGDTDAASTTDEFIVKNGVILYRDGDLIDTETVQGDIEGAYMNEDGDIGYIWDVQGGTLEALFLNDQLLVVEGDDVDLDGDSVPEPGHILRDFTGISALTISDRDINGRVNLYFTADIDTAGTSTTSDDIEGLFCVAVDLGPTPVRLSGLTATSGLRSRGVVVSWETALEIRHDGFHVYRSHSIDAGYERLNAELVRGQSPYSWTDETVRPRTTYFYKVGAVDLSGDEVLYGPVQVTTGNWGIATVLAEGRPNPFLRRTQIQFTLARESRAELAVFDVTGRRIATLVNGELPAGDHQVWWDGVAESGREAAAGVYFYRLDADGFTQTRKLVRIGQN